MTVLKTLGIFIVALLGELGGTYAVWRWLRTDSPPLLALVGVAALFGYAVVQTLQPEDRYGRLFAAYAGCFLIGALLWGWGVDGKQPDRFGLGRCGDRAVRRSRGALRPSNLRVDRAAARRAIRSVPHNVGACRVRTAGPLATPRGVSARAATRSASPQRVGGRRLWTAKR